MEGVPAKHCDIYNSHVKANKDANKKTNLQIYLQLSCGMNKSNATLHEHGVASTNEIDLELCTIPYELKQTGQYWSQLLHLHLVEAGFPRCKSDMCFYWKRGLVPGSVYVYDLFATKTKTAAVD